MSNNFGMHNCTWSKSAIGSRCLFGGSWWEILPQIVSPIYISIYEPRTFERLHEVHFLCRLREQSHRKIKFFPDKEINFQWSHFNFITANGILRSSQVIKISRGRGGHSIKGKPFQLRLWAGRPSEYWSQIPRHFNGLWHYCNLAYASQKEIDQIKYQPFAFWYFCIFHPRKRK